MSGGERLAENERAGVEFLGAPEPADHDRLEACVANQADCNLQRRRIVGGKRDAEFLSNARLPAAASAAGKK